MAARLVSWGELEFGGLNQQFLYLKDSVQDAGVVGGHGIVLTILCLPHECAEHLAGGCKLEYHREQAGVATNLLMWLTNK